MRIADIDKKFRDRITDQLKDEVPTLTDAQLHQLHFIVSAVGLDQIETYLSGLALELFRTRFGEDHGFNVHSWVRLIQGEIVRKNDYSSDKISNVSELIERKCIGKDAIVNSLNVVAKASAKLDMSIITDELRAKGWTTAEIIKISKELPLAKSDYTDATNTEVQVIASNMATHFDNHPQLQQSVSDYLSSAIDTMADTHSSPYNSRSYLGALAILVYHEKI